MTGKKESQGKLAYEFDREFIQALAERMQSNKGKYPPYNRMSRIDVELLKQSLFRHVMEIMQGNYDDDTGELSHLTAIAANCMFIYHQLKNHEQD